MVNEGISRQQMAHQHVSEGGAYVEQAKSEMYSQDHTRP